MGSLEYHLIYQQQEKKQKFTNQSDFTTKDTKSTKGRQETKGWKKEGALRTSMAFPLT